MNNQFCLRSQITNVAFCLGFTPVLLGIQWVHFVAAILNMAFTDCFHFYYFCVLFCFWSYVQIKEIYNIAFRISEFN